MKKSVILAGGIILCLILTVGFSIEPKCAVAKEKGKEMPLDLDGTKWEAEVTLVLKNGKTSVSNDTLMFEKNQFYSKRYKGEGFKPTNYSSSLNGDGTTKFGTMQNKDDLTAYWEGIIKGQEINGTIFIYSKKVKGVKEEYFFKGTMAGGKLKKKVMKGTMAKKVKLPPKPSLKSKPEPSPDVDDKPDVESKPEVGNKPDAPVVEELVSPEVEGEK